MKINEINKRYGVINVIHRLLILTYYYQLKWVQIMQKVHSLWVCFIPEGVIQNGSIFNIGVAPPPGFLVWLRSFNIVGDDYSST